MNSKKMVSYHAKTQHLVEHLPKQNEQTVGKAAFSFFFFFF